VNRGYKVALFVPETFSEEKVMIMRALGAEVTRTPDSEGMQGAIDRAKELASHDPKAFMASQFENPANPDYHYETTAREIFEQMEGKIDAVVIGAGTAGTFTGVARYLKERLAEGVGDRCDDARVGAWRRSSWPSQGRRHRIKFYSEDVRRVSVRRSHSRERR
jgi:cysteine synthase